VPKSGTPRTKKGSSHPADGFKRAKRIFTRKGAPRRRIRITTKKSGGYNIRKAPLLAAEANKLLRRLPPAITTTTTASTPVQPETHIVDGVTSQRLTGVSDTTKSGGGDDRGGGTVTGPSIDASDAADVSADFRGELAGVLALYGARIEAARRSLPASIAAGVVRALLNEQTAAMRSISERMQAASEKQRGDRPERPAQPLQRNNDDPKLS